MIVRRRTDGAMLADRRWLAAFYGLKAETIRKRWQPIACDLTTRAALYEWDENDADTMRQKTRARRRVAA